MLSIIVSSYQKKYFDNFSLNVKETIGENFRYEIIQIWNPGLMGICEAYNKGAELSKYDNLLFVHEDVLFETTDWGNKLLNHLNVPNTGVVGLAGSNIKTLFPISWWDVRVGYGNNLIQLDSKNEWVNNELFEDKPAIILDGVFLCIKKSVWLENMFDIKNKSFHGYDVEFCLNISKKYQNKIISNIKLKHFSQGSADVKWFNQLLDIYSKHKWTNSNEQLLKLEIVFFCNYLKKFSFTKYRKFLTFLKFYRPFNYSINENIKIIKTFVYYFKNE